MATTSRIAREVLARAGAGDGEDVCCYGPAQGDSEDGSDDTQTLQDVHEVPPAITQTDGEILVGSPLQPVRAWRSFLPVGQGVVDVGRRLPTLEDGRTP